MGKTWEDYIFKKAENNRGYFTPGQLSSKSDLFQTSFLIFNRLSWDFSR